MSIAEVKGKPGWYDVRVYDRVQVPGERPKPIDRRVKGKTAAEKVERDLKNQRDEGSLIGRNASLSTYCESYLRSRRAEVSRQTHHGYTITVHRYIDRHALGARRIGSVDVTTVRDFYADLLAGAGRDVERDDGTVVKAAAMAALKGTVRRLRLVFTAVRSTMPLTSSSLPLTRSSLALRSTSRQRRARNSERRRPVPMATVAA